jgi:hypothetical protein
MFIYDREALEDGPRFLAVCGPHAEEGGEIIEGMYAQGFTHTWKIWKGRRARYRLVGGANVFCSGNVYSETMPTNVITYQAISEIVTLQGVKDPRGTTGIHATRTRGYRCSQPPLGGLTK